MNNLNYLQEKLTHFELKYNNRPIYCSFRMICSSIYSLFIKNSKKLKNKPVIVFDIKGGLGDAIIASNFIYNLYLYIKDPNIMLIVYYPNKEILQTIFSGLPKQILLTHSKKQANGNLYIELNRFPKVPYILEQKNKRLQKLLISWHKFFTHNHKFFDLLPEIDGLANDYSEILGAKRFNQADIGGILGLTERFNYKIPIQNEEETLKKFNLLNRAYITLHLGIPLEKNALTNNKLWPEQYWQILIKKLKAEYPNYIIVLLGINKERNSHIFEGVDIDLRSKTSLEDIKVILKNSLLHIDTEGGFVHLRHALKGGPSVVLFGPTSPNVYGYTENLNLRSKACLKSCEWITNDWLTRCPRRTNKNICMSTLTPDFVFNEIKIKFKTPLP